MATFSLRAPVQGGLPDSVVDFITRGISPPPISTRVKSDQRLKKDHETQEHEASWTDAITLGRWTLDLGSISLEVPEPSPGVSVPAKRALSDDQLAKEPVKKTRLSYESRANLQTDTSGTLSTPTYSCVNLRHSGDTPRNPAYTLTLSKDDGRSPLVLLLEPGFSSPQRQTLGDLFTLTHTDIACRARTEARLGIEYGSAGSRVKLLLEFKWKNCHDLQKGLSGTPGKHFVQAADRILNQVCPGQAGLRNMGEFSPRTFYESVHVPPFRAEDAKEDFKVPGLQTGLYPFQKRTVRWMLSRERQESQSQNTLGHGFQQFLDADRNVFYYSPWLQLATRDINVASQTEGTLKGGILAEEMGLGKTVELISLMQLHKRDENELGLRNGLHRSGTTLVVAPKAVSEQWRDEIETHCPSLAVVAYTGRDTAGSLKSRLDDQTLIEYLTSHDIVLCDYNTFRKEVWSASDPPDRSRRADRVYERRRSILVQIEWWRVILDEAQQIQGSVTKAGEIARQLPRQNSWAVSGTPLKKDAIDLFGLLDFLHLSPYSWSRSLFENLINHHSPIFAKVIGTICLRHSKDQVRADLQLPPQKRVVINVPFTAIEEQNYAQLFEEMALDCGLHVDGSPLKDDWNPESRDTIARMRDWLARLRKLCLHPEVAVGRRTAGGRDAPIRTVEEVLGLMIENNETDQRNQERLRAQSILKRGQILEHADKPQEALKVWQLALDEVTRMVSADRQVIKEEVEGTGNPNFGSVNGAGHRQDDSTPRLSRLSNRLRVSLELQHSAVFFIANANYQIKTNESLTTAESERFKELEQEETARYEEAKVLRRELLSTSATAARSLMGKMQQLVDKDGFIRIEGFKALPLNGGLESRKYIDQLEDVIDVLNQEAEMLDAWRQELSKALLLPLVDQEDSELTGEEYENSTKDEDKIHAYMEALRLLIADRSQLASGQRNFNVRREASRLLRESIAGEGHAPELMKELLRNVDSIRMAENKDGDLEVWLRGAVTQLTQLRGTLIARSGRAGEVALVDQILADVRPRVEKTIKTVSGLEKELEVFSDTVNARVEYYRQLQVISDLVAPFEEAMSPEAQKSRLEKMQQDEIQHQTKASALHGRWRFLQHIKSDSQSMEKERICIVCTDPFDNGVLTSCGHVYCKDCISLWWSQHKNCPSCKQPLSKTDMYPITYKPIQVSVEETGQSRSPGTESFPSNESPDASQGPAIYVGIEQKALDEIRSIDLSRSYGTKIDMLARHILWLRERDSGAKSIIFSQFGDFFEVLKDAFDRFRIGWASLEETHRDRKLEAFRKDPKVDVLFLHAQSQAAGLNLVNATHVFLAEPLINTAIELQVIARVHRIGQHSPTTVWMYLIENTVEKSIYDISVERRMAHIQSSPTKKKRSNGTKSPGDAANADAHNFEAEVDAANSMAISAPSGRLLVKGKAGGESVAPDDLWPCLFTHRPATHSAITEAAQSMAATHLAGDAAEARRQNLTLRPSTSDGA